MLNKSLIILVLIINYFFISYANSNDQLNFDVSQIEILEGGNKIIGKKRGTITTNDGVIINADDDGGEFRIFEMMDVSENTTSTRTVATGSSSASNYESTAAAAKDFEDALNDVSKFQNKLPTFELADGWRIDVKPSTW